MSKVLLWIWPVGFIAVFIYSLFHGPDERVLAYRALVDRNEVAEATITSTDCPDHGHFYYDFPVRGRRYAGSTYWIGRPCDEVRPGQSLSIRFDPTDPTVNSTMQPAAAYEFHKTQLMAKFFMAAAMLCMLFYPIAKPRLDAWLRAKREAGR
jgi:hypothetical protein